MDRIEYIQQLERYVQVTEIFKPEDRARSEVKLMNVGLLEEILTEDEYRRLRRGEIVVKETRLLKTEYVDLQTFLAANR